MTETMADSLSKVQREAVEYIDGPSLVIAGAGSGKTRVLTYKIAYLMEHGYKPWNILALTFTNKAAKEMKDRIAKIVNNGDAHYLVMGTFHSIFSRILRYEAERIGYDRNYTIYDDADSRAVIKAATRTILKEIIATKYKTEEEQEDALENALKSYKTQTIASRIGLAKNSMIDAKRYGETTVLVENDTRNHIPETYKIYKAYERLLRENNAMDFDDLLLNTYLLLKNNEDIRQKYAQLYQFILVDEYQDTNVVQQKILELLARDHHRLCVVGDDAQSIYAFRGANIDNILNFEKVYPEFKQFKLEENYRSTKSIVAVANDLISHNQRQIEKNVFSNNGTGEKPQLIKAASDEVEASIVAQKIIRINAVEHIPYNEMVILYRTNAQSRKFEDVFRRMGILYKIYGGVSFYQRAEIKNILAYFRLIVNPKDDEALLRIINYPKRGIGDTTVNAIKEKAKKDNIKIWDLLTNPIALPQELKESVRKRLNKFVTLIEGFYNKRYEVDAVTLGRLIIEKSGISEDLYREKSHEGEARVENLQEFYNSLHEFVRNQSEEGNQDQITIADFLQQAALQTDQESVDAKDDNTPKVTMMTMHAAKGLEFDCVFIVGLEEELFPSPRSVESQRALEEERRLLYVAITRAKKLCHLLYAESRYLYGQWQSNPVSRFIKEINPGLLFQGSSDGATKSHYSSSFTTRSGSLFGSQPSYGSYSASSQRGGVSVPSNFRRISSAPTTSSAASSSTSTATPSAASSAALNIASKQKSDRGNLTIGATIEHTRFGRGKVINIEGTGDNEKATVEFEQTGKKQLLLKFALGSITVI